MPLAGLILAMANDDIPVVPTAKITRRCLRDKSNPLSLSDSVFASYYRLNKDAFVMVLNEIEPFMPQSSIPAVIQLATVLRYLAVGSFQAVIGKDSDLNLHRTTVGRILWRIVGILEQIICPTWIQLEQSNEERHQTKRYFFNKFGIGGIIGCMDGTHIRIIKPSSDDFAFYNRKGFYSINAMIGLCGGPDVPTHHRSDHDRASLLTADYTRKSSVDSAGGSLFDGSSSTRSSSSSLSNIDEEAQSLYSDDDCQEVVKQILQHENPISITIKLHVTEDKFTEWESVLNPENNILYVAMPDELPPEASKETFISLLEFAEEKLDVDAVVLCVRKNRSDRARLLETFLIMGFELLSRKSPLAPPASKNDSENFFLIYHIQD